MTCAFACICQLSGSIQDLIPPAFSRAASLPGICEALIKAAYDPRIKGLYVGIDPLDCGWAKLTEIRRHIAFFRQSGKFSIAYIDRGGEKEYFLASACEEVYTPSSGNLFLRGLSVQGIKPSKWALIISHRKEYGYHIMVTATGCYLRTTSTTFDFLQA